jgi:alpha-tubulin suppressor-like RCC1 family protein
MAPTVRIARLACGSDCIAVMTEPGRVLAAWADQPFEVMPRLGMADVAVGRHQLGDGEDAVFALGQDGALWAWSRREEALGFDEAVDEDLPPDGAPRDLVQIQTKLDLERDEIRPRPTFKGLAAAEDLLAAVSSTGQLFACGQICSSTECLARGRRT